jgi:hypothetical protein
MKISKQQNSSMRRVATILGAAALLMTTAQPTVVLAKPELSSLQRSQASELASKLVDLAKSLGPNATEGAFEGAFADAVTGYDTAVIEAALADVAGTPGLSEKALRAARRLGKVYAANDGDGPGTGAVGGNGGTAGYGGPGFSGGGGGSNYGH